MHHWTYSDVLLASLMRRRDWSLQQTVVDVLVKVFGKGNRG